MPGGSVIGGNTSNITANSTNIDNLAKQIGTYAGPGVVNDQLGVISGVANITSPAVSVIAALTELDVAVEVVRASTVANATTGVENSTKITTEHSMLTALYTALMSALDTTGGNPKYASADDLASAIRIAIDGSVGALA